MKLSIFTLCISLHMAGFTQPNYEIETSDINNFRKAHEALSGAKTKVDSIRVIQEMYIEMASSGFTEFLRVRKFTAEEYVEKISHLPNFWNSIRESSLKIRDRKDEIEQVLNELSQGLPEFKKPKVCFAIGCLRTGGTVSKDWILIGSEMAAADATVDKSELPEWLKNVIGKPEITAMVAHEAIHTQQNNSGKYNLLTGAITEGSADFPTFKILGKNINSPIHIYGNANECELKTAFLSDLKEDPTDFSGWLFNGSKSKDRPANPGYYIGFKIAEAYYECQPDKQVAIKNLMNRKKYKQVFKLSEYGNSKCE